MIMNASNASNPSATAPMAASRAGPRALRPSSSAFMAASVRVEIAGMRGAPVFAAVAVLAGGEGGSERLGFG